MKSIMEIVRYGAVGVVNTLSDFIIFSLLYYIFDVNVLIANTLAWLFAVSQGFLLNKYWTFHEYRDGSLTSGQAGKQYLLFVLINLGCLFISNGTVYLLIEYYPALVAKLVAAVFVLIWGFAFSKKLIFRAQRVTP